MAKSALFQLKPLYKCAIQPYFSKRIQLADIIEWIIRQIGHVHLVISTFSTSEEFLRRLDKMKTSLKILHCQMFCDLRAARKTILLKHFIESVFDEAFLCENHSKVVLLFNDKFHVAIVTSQNQTRGDRYEAGIITTDDFTFDCLNREFCAMAENSISISQLNVQSGTNQ